jgi:hypothetical protein
MSVSDYIEIAKWIVGGIAGFISLCFAALWYVRAEAAKNLSAFATESRGDRGVLDQRTHDLEARMGAEVTLRSMEMIKLREELSEFRVSVAGSMFSRRDAESMQKKVEAIQGTVDRMTGKIDALCAGLLKSSC